MQSRPCPRLLLTCLLVFLPACSPAYDPSDALFEKGGFESTGVVRVQRPAAPALAEATPGVLKPGDTLLIGSWNIQWLDSPGQRNGKPAQKPDDLAHYIAASQVDVLAVQEIGAVVADGLWRSHTLERVVQLLTESGRGAWRYMLFPNADDDLRQLTGVMWNADRVQMLGWRPAPIDRTSATEIWHRHPVAVKFSAGHGLTDLLVVPIHMRCCLDADLRRREAETLTAALPGLTDALADQDVLIIGDANMWNHREPAGDVYRDAGLEDLNADDRPTHTANQPFDRAYLLLRENKRGPEFAESRLDVFAAEYLRPNDRSPGEFGKRFSDHYLVRVPVKVLPDDD